MAVLICTSAILLVSAYSNSFEDSSVRAELDLVNADASPTSNTYCSIFADPEECEQQKEGSEHKYWTKAEIRNELWNTMKGLAELEIRENQHLRERFEKREETKHLFELFKKTMTQEVSDVHTLQAQMSTKHTRAFRNLSSQLLLSASLLKNFTDSGLSFVNNKVTRLSLKEETDYRDSLALLGRRVAGIYAHIDALHAQSTHNISEAQQYSELVGAEMRRQDKEILAQVAILARKAAELKAVEAEHNQLLSGAEATIASKEANDTARLDKHIDEGVEQARAELGSRLAVQRAAIREMTLVGFANLSHRFDLERNRSVAETQSLNVGLDSIAAARKRASTAQSRELAAARTALTELKATLRQRIDALDLHANYINSTLIEAAARLGRAVVATGDELRDRLANNISRLGVDTETLYARVASETHVLGGAVNMTRANLEKFFTELRARLQMDSAQLEAHIITAVADFNSSLRAALGRNDAEASSALDTERTARVTAIGQLRKGLSASNSSLWAQLRAVISQEGGSSAERDQELAVIEKALSDLRADTATTLRALDSNATGTAQSLEQDRGKLAEEAHADRLEVEALIAASFDSVLKNLTNKVSLDGTAGHAQIGKDVADIQAKITALKFDSTRVEEGLWQDLGYQSAHQKQIDEDFARNVSLLSARLIHLKQRLGSHEDAITSRLGQLDATLQDGVRAMEKERAADEATFTREINVTTEDERARGRLEVSDSARAIAANMSLLAEALLGQLALVRSSAERGKEELLSGLAASEQGQDEVNSKELQVLETLKSRVSTAMLEFGNRTESLDRGLAALAEETGHVQQNLSSRISAAHLNATKRLDREITKLANKSKLTLQEEHQQEAAALHASFSGFENQFEAAYVKLQQTIHDLGQNSSIIRAQEEDARDEILDTLQKYSEKEKRDSDFFKIESDLLSQNASRLVHSMHKSAAALKNLLENEFGALETNINATYVSVGDAVRQKTDAASWKLKNYVSEAVMQTNLRILSLRNDTAKISHALGSEIANAEQTELDHDKDQNNQIANVRARQLQDKEVVDALILKLQSELEVTRNELAKARENILFKEAQDSSELRANFEDGLKEVYKNTTLILDGLHSSFGTELNGRLKQVRVVLVIMLFV